MLHHRQIPFAENSPPSAAVCVILILLLISVLLYRFRRSFGLVTAELVVVYCRVAGGGAADDAGHVAPLVRVAVAFPHHQDFKSYQSLPSMLWPHGYEFDRESPLRQ